MVLRMEDLDPDRCRAAYAEQLADDLRWLGLDWDEGYQKGGAHGPYLQSERTARYAAAFRALEERGLVYPCYCTRAERLAASAPHRSDGQVVYSGKCRHLTEEERARLAQTRCPAWRLIVPDQEISFTDGLQGTYRENLLRDCGDFILRRSDGVYAYQLAVVCDDGDMGALRERFTPAELTGRLAFWAGQTDRPELVTPAELAGCFEWKNVPRGDIIVEQL